MRNELQHIEEIERYLQGRMSEAERSAFQLRMQNDPNLQQDLELQKQIVERIQVNAFRNEMMAFHAGFVEGSSTGGKNRSRFFYLNTILIVLLAGTAVATSIYLIRKNYFGTETAKQVVHSIQPDKNFSSVNSSNYINSEIDSLESPTEIIEETINPTPKKLQPKKLIPDQGEDSPCKAFEQVYLSGTIDAEKGGDVIMLDSKSAIHIPANAIVDEKGNTVTGEVEILYREYRNQAEMAFSGLPMIFTENNEEYRFNSAGMFEVRAFQGEEELKMAEGKSFIVDYNVTDQVDSCFFFELEEKTSKWKKLRQIVFNKGMATNAVSNKKEKDTSTSRSIVSDVPGQLFIKITDAKTGLPLEGESLNFNGSIQDYKYLVVKNDSLYQVVECPSGNKTFTVRCPGYEPEQIEMTVYPGMASDVKVKLHPIEGAAEKAKMPFYKRFVHFFKRKEKKADVPVEKIQSTHEVCDSVRKNVVRPKITRRGGVDATGNGFIRSSGMGDFKQPDNTKQNQVLGFTDPGHTFPNMVNGLRCENFGVYNCDGIGIVKDQIAISATYKTEGGKEIENQFVLSLIDLKINAAFSFKPGFFTCSKSGRNVLLLFTEDKRLFVLPESEYAAMRIKSGGNQVFTMTEITTQVKDTRDLKKYLGI